MTLNLKSKKIKSKRVGIPHLELFSKHFIFLDFCTRMFTQCRHDSSPPHFLCILVQQCVYADDSFRFDLKQPSISRKQNLYDS